MRQIQKIEWKLIKSYMKFKETPFMHSFLHKRFTDLHLILRKLIAENIFCNDSVKICHFLFTNSMQISGITWRIYHNNNTWSRRISHFNVMNKSVRLKLKVGNICTRNRLERYTKCESKSFKVIHISIKVWVKYLTQWSK